MPEFARQKIIRKVQLESPAVVETIMSEVLKDVNKYFDIKHMVISNLLKDKRMLNDIFQKVGRQEFKFFSNAGFWFGLGIGVIQMVCWLLLIKFVRLSCCLFLGGKYKGSLQIIIFC